MERLTCKYTGCVEKREGFPGSEIYCAFHAKGHYEAVRSKPNEKPVILYCPTHGAVTTSMRPHEARPARFRHAKAGCDAKLQTFVLDPTR